MAEDSFLLQFLFFLSSLVTALAALPLLAAALREVLGGIVWVWLMQQGQEGVIYRVFLLTGPSQKVLRASQ